MKIKKAVIPAAGLGTRVLPASKAMPKEMLPIVDKPAIQYIVEEAARSGIEDILIILSRGKGVVADHFDRSPELEQHLLKGQKDAMYETVSEISKLANISYVRQVEMKGLGHAVLCAESLSGASRSPSFTGMTSSLGRIRRPLSSPAPMRRTGSAVPESRRSLQRRF